MDDSLYDSDQTTSREQNSTEIEEELQIQTEFKDNRLQQLNDNLTKENNALKAQFNEAVHLTTKVDVLHKKISDLSQENNSLSLEKEDLKNRLDIALRANDEINEQLKHEKSKLYSQRKDDTANFQKQLQLNKDSHKQQMQKLYDDLDKLSQIKEHYEIDLKMINTTIQKILSSANHYFQVTFCKAEDLIQYFEQPPVIQPPQDTKDTTEKCQIDEKAIIEGTKQRFKFKIKQLKQIIDENQITQENLKAENSKLQKELKDITISSNKTIFELKKEINQINDDHVLIIDDKKHQISQLESKIESLKGELIKRKDEQRRLILEVQSQHKDQAEDNQKPLLHPYINEFDLANEQMNQRITELESQINSLNEKLNESNDTIKELTQTIVSKDLMIDKLNHQISSSEMVHQTTLTELGTLRNALHAKSETPADSNTRKRKIHALKGQLITLKKSNESEIKQNRELSTLNEKLTHSLEQQCDENRRLKRELELSENRIQVLNDEISSAQQEMALKLTQNHPDVIPANAWRYNEFDTTLTTLLDSISMSPTLQPATKLQNIYKAINKYFKDQLTQKDKMREELMMENQNIKELFNQFFVDISIALSQKPSGFDSYHSKCACKELTDTVICFRNECDDTKRKIEIYDSVIQHLIETMNFPDTREASTLITEINELNARIIIQAQNLQKRKKRIQSLKSMHNTYKQKAETNAFEINEENSKLKETVAMLTNNIKELNANIQGYKETIHKQKLEIEDTHRNLQDNENQFNFEKDTILKEKEEVEGELNQTINELTSKLLTAEEKIKRDEIANKRLNKLIQNLRETITEKEEKIKSVIIDKDGDIANLTEKWGTEKQQIIHTYEDVINKMKASSEEQRKDVDKLVHDISDAQKKLKKSKEALSSLRKDKAQLERDIEAQKLETQRVKKETEATAKTQMAAAESDFNTKLDQQKSKCEVEKKKLFAFAAEQFRVFFNPQDSLDETTFKCLISKASSELGRLISADFAIRKMIGAQERQKTDEAVAQFVANY